MVICPFWFFGVFGTPDLGIAIHNNHQSCDIGACLGQHFDRKPANKEMPQEMWGGLMGVAKGTLGANDLAIVQPLLMPLVEQ